MWKFSKCCLLSILETVFLRNSNGSLLYHTNCIHSVNNRLPAGTDFEINAYECSWSLWGDPSQAIMNIFQLLWNAVHNFYSSSVILDCLWMYSWLLFLCVVWWVRSFLSNSFLLFWFVRTVKIIFPTCEGVSPCR